MKGRLQHICSDVICHVKDLGLNILLEQRNNSLQHNLCTLQFRDFRTIWVCIPPWRFSNVILQLPWHNKCFFTMHMGTVWTYLLYCVVYHFHYSHEWIINWSRCPPSSTRWYQPEQRILSWRWIAYIFHAHALLYLCELRCLNQRNLQEYWCRSDHYIRGSSLTPSKSSQYFNFMWISLPLNVIRFIRSCVFYQ